MFEPEKLPKVEQENIISEPSPSIIHDFGFRMWIFPEVLGQTCINVSTETQGSYIKSTPGLESKPGMEILILFCGTWNSMRPPT